MKLKYGFPDPMEPSFLFKRFPAFLPTTLFFREIFKISKIFMVFQKISKICMKFQKIFRLNEFLEKRVEQFRSISWHRETIQRTPTFNYALNKIFNNLTLKIIEKSLKELFNIIK